MTLQELQKKLAARKALIVHFSHFAKMRDDVVFPIDLQQVLAEVGRWPLSCSVLTPGHGMDVVGSVGVVLEPRSAEDVLRVHHDDAGAYDDGGENQSLGEPLSDASFDASLDQVLPGRYNEWRVQGAQPTGLFVVDPANIDVQQTIKFEMPWGMEETTGPVRISLDQLRALFPAQPIWTMAPDGPREL